MHGFHGLIVPANHRRASAAAELPHAHLFLMWHTHKGACVGRESKFECRGIIRVACESACRRIGKMEKKSVESLIFNVRTHQRKMEQ